VRNLSIIYDPETEQHWAYFGKAECGVKHVIRRCDKGEVLVSDEELKRFEVVG